MKKHFDRLLNDTARCCKSDWDSVVAARATLKEEMRRNPENLPDKEGMRRRRSGCCPAIRTGPLIGFLERNVGKPWNDVWSEICSASDPRTHLGWNMRRLVSAWVDTSHCKSNFWNIYRFYVKDGILCERDNCKGFIRRAGSRYVSPRKTSDPVVRILNHNTALYKQYGIWYRVGLEEVVDNKPFYDCVYNSYAIRRVATVLKVLPPYRKSVYYGNYFTKLLSRHSGPAMYAKTKKQLGKKELKAYGLKK